MVNDPAYLPATALAELARTRQIGALELMDRYLSRIAQHNGRINAIVVRDFDRARARAKELDQRTDKSAPMFGVPTTVKESIHVAGLSTTYSHPELRTGRCYAPLSRCVGWRRRAPWCFGKTKLPVDLADWQSFNPVYGVTSNPWDLSRTSGGSSGGSAAAVAAGLTGFDTGSDTGGSLRVPAHFCGIYAHKPSWGLVPVYADPAVSLAANPDISVAGPIGRIASDLALGLAIMAGPDEEEARLTVTLPLPRVALESVREEIPYCIWVLLIGLM